MIYSKGPLDAPELLDGFYDGVELVDERIHAVFAEVEFLRKDQDLCGACPRHNDHAVLVGDDDVVGLDVSPSTSRGMFTPANR